MATDEKKKSKILPVVLILIVLTSLGYGINKYIYSMHHEDTDDAQVDADISPVLTRVSGYIQVVRFEDNQQVNKGDTLMLLDNRDFMLKVEQAEAAVQNASAGILSARTALNTAQSSMQVAQSNINAAKVRVWKATEDFNRYKNLLAADAVSKIQYDASKAEKESAEATLQSVIDQLDVAKKQVESAQQQIAVAQSQEAIRKADLNFAKLQASYSVIIAPISGLVSKKSVLEGQYVNAGNPLCAIVSGHQNYVIANFKETQLEKMKEGQDVEVEADAFPGTEIRGKLYSFSAATGAKFSLLPPDNASGNFVKVVQRVPVKIILDEKQEIVSRLRPGMSVKVSVNVN